MRLKSLQKFFPLVSADWITSTYIFSGRRLSGSPFSNIRRTTHTYKKKLARKIKLRALAGCSFILCLLITSGCSLLSPASTETSLKTLVKERKYEKALLLLDQEAEQLGNATDKTAQKLYIKRLIHDYEKESIAAAEKHVHKGDLAQAITIIENSLEKIPSSKRLEEYYKPLLAERNVRLTRTEHQLLLAQAKYLLAKKELFSEKKRVEGPRFASWWNWKKTEKTFPKLGKELLVCGKEALKRQELKLAGECLRVSQVINNSPKVQKTLAQWRHQQDEQLKKRVNKRHKKSFDKVKDARTNALNALSNADYQVANKWIKILHDLNGVTPELENIIDEKVETLLSKGNRLYRSGKIREARDAWQTVLLLAPNNIEAAAHIERAERVLKRLQELRQ